MSALLDVAIRHGAPPGLGSLLPANILVSVDFTAAALWSIRCAGDIAAHHGSSIGLLHALEWGAFPDDLRNLILTKPGARLLQDTKAN